VSIQTARNDWERAASELEAQSKESRRRQQLLDAVDAVTAELRARVGQTYTLEELVDAYGESDRWGRDAIWERAPYDGWPRDVALAVDAAFHAYARGAVNFEP
jgi:hypothetical protein